MFLVNAYGMSESTGPQTIALPHYFDKFDDFCIKSTGKAIDGTDMKI